MSLYCLSLYTLLEAVTSNSIVVMGCHVWQPLSTGCARLHLFSISFSTILVIYPISFHIPHFKPGLLGIDIFQGYPSQNRCQTISWLVYFRGTVLLLFSHTELVLGQLYYFTLIHHNSRIFPLVSHNSFFNSFSLYLSFICNNLYFLLKVWLSRRNISHRGILTLLSPFARFSVSVSEAVNSYSILVLCFGHLLYLPR